MNNFYWLLQEKPVDKRPAHFFGFGFGWRPVYPAGTITHFMVVFCVESNALNTLLVFDNNFWDLENFWMITHFVAVFFVRNYTSDRG